MQELVRVRLESYVEKENQENKFLSSVWIEENKVKTLMENVVENLTNLVHNISLPKLEGKCLP